MAKTKWTTIKVPKEVYEKFKALRESTGKSGWRLLLEAISFYGTISRRPTVKEELPDIEKASWYITKLGTSFGAFKENPSPKNFSYLKARINELKERLGVDGSHLLILAEKYLKTKDIMEAKSLRAELNMSFKMIVKEIILQAMNKEEQKDKQ